MDEQFRLVVPRPRRPPPNDRPIALETSDGRRRIARRVARCHDEQDNSLALNLMHDIVTGQKTVQAARDYYAKEFLDARRKQPTPYMEKLIFMGVDSSAADPDERILSDEQLNEAEAAGGTRA